MHTCARCVYRRDDEVEQRLDIGADATRLGGWDDVSLTWALLLAGSIQGLALSKSRTRLEVEVEVL